MKLNIILLVVFSVVAAIGLGYQSFRIDSLEVQLSNMDKNFGVMIETNLALKAHVDSLDKQLSIVESELSERKAK